MLRKLNLFLSPQFLPALCKVGLSGSYFKQDGNFSAVLLQIVCHVTSLTDVINYIYRLGLQATEVANLL